MSTLWWLLEASTFLSEEHATCLHLCPWEGLFLALLIKVPTSRFWNLHLPVKPGTSIRPCRRDICISLLSQGASEKAITWDNVFCFLFCLNKSTIQNCPGSPPCCQALGSMCYAAGVFSNHKQWPLYKMAVPPQGSSCLFIQVIRENNGGAHQLFEGVTIFRIEKSKLINIDNTQSNKKGYIFS